MEGVLSLTQFQPKRLEPLLSLCSVGRLQQWRIKNSVRSRSRDKPRWRIEGGQRYRKSRRGKDNGRSECKRSRGRIDRWMVGVNVRHHGHFISKAKTIGDQIFITYTWATSRFRRRVNHSNGCIRKHLWLSMCSQNLSDFPSDRLNLKDILNNSHHEFRFPSRDIFATIESDETPFLPPLGNTARELLKKTSTLYTFLESRAQTHNTRF